MGTRSRIRWFELASETVKEEFAPTSAVDGVVARLKANGQIVLSVERATEPWPAVGSKLDVAWWCRELRTLLQAGMTVVEALETLHAQPLGQARARVHEALVVQLRQGQALSAAMLSTGAFPAVLVAGVKAGERTSALIPALDDYLRYDALLERLRKQVVSASIYPALVVGLGLAVVVFLLLFVMPKFSRMYGELQGGASTATRVLVSLSNVMAEHALLTAGVMAALAVAALMAWRAGWLARVGLAFAQALPPIRHQLTEFQRAKLYQSLALMFRGGYSLDEALGQSAVLGLSAEVSSAVLSAKAALSRGQRVSKAFEEAGLTDVVSQRLLAVGERTGSFDRVLETIAERHAAAFTTFVERATRIVEPVLLMLVALMVGGIVVAMYMPVFDIASSIR